MKFYMYLKQKTSDDNKGTLGITAIKGASSY